jgi:hypothetical protein
MYSITKFAVIYGLTSQAVLRFHYRPAVVNSLLQFFLYDLLSSVDHRIEYFYSSQFSPDFSISHEFLEVVPSKDDINSPIKRNCLQ